MQQKLLIFDCDGVLRNFSWEALFQTYIAMGKFLGINFLGICSTPDEFKEWHNHDWKENLFNMGAGEDRIPELNKIFHKSYDTYIHVFGWVSLVLKELLKHGNFYKIAVLSNSSTSSVSLSLNGIMPYFQKIVGYDLVDRQKPHPDGIYLIMDELGFSQSNDIWMIGDTSTDVEAGKSAGVKTAVVTWGATEGRKNLEKLGSDRIINHPCEFLTL